MVKQGGVSWNRSGNAKQGVSTKFACSICGRQYKMLWAKQVHEKLCEEYNNVNIEANY